MNTLAQQYYQQAITYIEQQQWAAAISCLEQTLQLQTPFPEAQAALLYAQSRLSTIPPTKPTLSIYYPILTVIIVLLACLAIVTQLSSSPSNPPQQLAQVQFWVAGQPLDRPYYTLHGQTHLTLTVHLYDTQGKVIPPTALVYHWTVYPTLPNQTIRQDTNGMVYYELPPELTEQLVTVVVENQAVAEAVTQSLIISQ